jgi:hypothetical protein
LLRATPTPISGALQADGSSECRRGSSAGVLRANAGGQAGRRFGGSEGRELSAIKNVARSTTTATPQRGHFGDIVLPVTPSRYESAQLQCGQGRNRPVAMLHLHSGVARNLDETLAVNAAR